MSCTVINIIRDTMVITVFTYAVCRRVADYVPTWSRRCGLPLCPCASPKSVEDDCRLRYLPLPPLGSMMQSWKKLHAAHAVRADIFVRIEDILVQKPRTNVVIAELYGDFDLF